MARIARVVIPNYPHHVTQRGNRRQLVFFNDGDYQAYLSMMSAALKKAEVEVWAYCLMPNHVHLVVTPKKEDGLRRFFGEAHRRYTRRINFREGWRGHLWQERFHSFVMDENYLLAAVRYVELNPVRAGLCSRAEEWRWSSVHAHLSKEDDSLVTVKPMLSRINNWLEYLGECSSDETINLIRLCSRTGRPLGMSDFMDQVERLVGCSLRKQKPGPRLKE